MSCPHCPHCVPVPKPARSAQLVLPIPDIPFSKNVSAAINYFERNARTFAGIVARQLVAVYQATDEDIKNFFLERKGLTVPKRMRREASWRQELAIRRLVKDGFLNEAVAWKSTPTRISRLYFKKYGKDGQGGP